MSTPSFLDMFRRVVAEPSVSSLDARHDSSNAGVIALLAEWLEELGFSIQIVPVSDRPQKLNLIARIGQGEHGLVLAGHTDTVPYDDRGWNTDPFALTERDDRYYGLGSADMKSFFPIALEAIQQIDLKNLARPLTVIATADEESSMAGVKHIQADDLAMYRYAVIGEPTGLRPIHAHKGILIEAIRLLGLAGHASNPKLGRNAIDGMLRVLESLVAWREELAQEHQDSAFEVPGPTLNFGNIHGGDSPNRICAACELQIDMRILPHMPFASVRSSLRQRVEKAIAGLELELHLDSLGSGGVPPLSTPVTSPIVSTLERLSGQSASTVGFATEGPFLNGMGLETVIFGPGDIAQAHQPNEYLAKPTIAPAIDILTKTIHAFCC